MVSWVDAEDGRRPENDLRKSDIRASDADRGGVVELLTQAATDGRLTLEEYSERSATAYAARTVGELTVLTSDLVAAHGLGAGVAEPLSTGAEKMVAIFGNESRKGRWTVPEHLHATSIFGDCHIEMQDAVLQHRVTTIDATARFGSVTIFVPDGVDVRMSGRAIFGGKSSKLRGSTHPGAPVLLVRCEVFCGAVTVRPPGRNG